MSDPNINPYYDNSVEPMAPIIDVRPPLAVGDSGMPGWMPIAAPFVGLGLFAVVAIVAFALTGTETPPTQGAQQAATSPAKTNASQPDATATTAQQQQQASPQQQPQSRQPVAAAPPQKWQCAGDQWLVAEAIVIRFGKTEKGNNPAPQTQGYLF